MGEDLARSGLVVSAGSGLGRCYPPLICLSFLAINLAADVDFARVIVMEVPSVEGGHHHAWTGRPNADRRYRSQGVVGRAPDASLVVVVVDR